LHKPHRDSTAPKSSVDGTLSPLPADVSVTLSVVSASMPITGQSIYHQQITKKNKNCQHPLSKQPNKCEPRFETVVCLQRWFSVQLNGKNWELTA